MHDVSPLALIVEDTPQIAQLLERVLKAQGYRTHIASTVRAAKAYVATASPRLITLDLQLPDGSGEAFLHRLRVNPTTAHIPVVVISGSLEQALELTDQVQARIAKPFVLDELIAVVQRLRSQQPLLVPMQLGEPGGSYG